MAITNGYCTLAELKASLAITDSVDDTPLEAAVTSASRMIDDYTGRFFYKDGTTQAPVYRYYTPEDAYILPVDDFVSISQIATDDNFNQTYESVWTTGDFLTEPINNPRRGWPYSAFWQLEVMFSPTSYRKQFAFKAFGDGQLHPLRSIWQL